MFSLQFLASQYTSPPLLSALPSERVAEGGFFLHFFGAIDVEGFCPLYIGSSRHLGAFWGQLEASWERLGGVDHLSPEGWLD